MLSFMHAWLFPDPNSPTNSVRAWVSIPPPRSLFRLLDPIESLSRFFRLSQSCLAFMKSKLIVCLAALMILIAALDSRLALSMTSRMGATARASMQSKPASVSLAAVIGPTPSKSVMDSIFSTFSADFSTLSDKANQEQS